MSPSEVQMIFPNLDQHSQLFSGDDDKDNSESSDTNWSDDDSPLKLPAADTLKSYLSFQPQPVYEANSSKLISIFKSVENPSIFPYQSTDTVEFVHLVTTVLKYLLTTCLGQEKQ